MECTVNTQATIAFELGTNQQTISNWIKNRCRPCRNFQKKILELSFRVGINKELFIVDESKIFRAIKLSQREKKIIKGLLNLSRRRRKIILEELNLLIELILTKTPN